MLPGRDGQGPCCCTRGCTGGDLTCTYEEQGTVCHLCRWTDLAARFLHAVSQAAPEGLGTRVQAVPDDLGTRVQAARGNLGTRIHQDRQGPAGAWDVLGEDLPDSSPSPSSAHPCQGAFSAITGGCSGGGASSRDGESLRASQQERQQAATTGQAYSTLSGLEALALAPASEPPASNSWTAGLAKDQLVVGAAPPSSVPLVFFLPRNPGAAASSATNLLLLESILKQLLVAVQALQHPQQHRVSSSAAASPSSRMVCSSTFPREVRLS